ncbi:hypothetical protein NDU88_007025 [Pleurodeles waltl]|uniref:Uncharacterized protein n=1 Tax=Pleurodeles waltl TaxID=8319 RepID=A0AAV7PNM3_PLEWA|nr:hypothetical protein NDU88_007025 [Pleurodeles waltl]
MAWASGSTLVLRSAARPGWASCCVLLERRLRLSALGCGLGGRGWDGEVPPTLEGLGAADRRPSCLISAARCCVPLEPTGQRPWRLMPVGGLMTTQVNLPSAASRYGTGMLLRIFVVPSNITFVKVQEAYVSPNNRNAN